jgi:CRISPR/Cas system endoribonuclease Cas6 (RAMP superfamily)
MQYGRYVFRCILEDDVMLPTFKGSTIRGVFGHALKKVVCALRLAECNACILKSTCVYYMIFEEGEPAGARIAAKPHPYIIEPPLDSKTTYKKGENLEFNIILIGKANDYLPYFICAFENIGSSGIGKRINGKASAFILDEVIYENETIYSSGAKTLLKVDNILEIRADAFLQTESNKSETGSITMRIETPLRLKFENTLEKKPKLSFHILTRAMLRRVSSLFESYGGGEPRLDYKGLVAKASEIEIPESNLSWYDWRRYSNRQDQAMFMGGLVGQITYKGAIYDFMSLFRFCEIFHIGKQTAFGLGKIEII